MTPAYLLALLRLTGFTVRADGDLIRIAPASRLTPEQVAEVLANRDGLLELLRVDGDERLERSVGLYAHPRMDDQVAGFWWQKRLKETYGQQKRNDDIPALAPPQGADGAAAIGGTADGGTVSVAR